MPTNLPDLDSYPDLTFPEAGLDLAAEFETQAPLTTPVGLNVRGYEPLSGRARGGSRPGLSKYIATTVAGAHLIQHLNVVVDPHPRGLPAFGGGGGGGGGPGGTGDGVDLGGGLVPDPHEGEAPDVPDTGTTTDPSTNNNSDRNNGNRDPRVGGTGNQPNRHLPPPTPPPPDRFVQTQQSFDEVFSGTNHDYPTALDADVTGGNLVLAWVKIDYSGHGGAAATPTLTVTDDQGGLWHLAESLGSTDFVAHYYLYYANAALSAALTVNVNVATAGAGVTSPAGSVIVVEYRGVAASAPLDAHASARGTVSAQSSGSFGPGALTLASSDELVVAFFHGGFLGVSTVAVSMNDGPEFAVRTFINAVSLTHIGYVADDTHVTATGIGNAVTPVLTWSTISGGTLSSVWAAVGASFRAG